MDGPGLALRFAAAQAAEKRARSSVLRKRWFAAAQAAEKWKCRALTRPGVFAAAQAAEKAIWTFGTA